MLGEFINKVMLAATITIEEIDKLFYYEEVYIAQPKIDGVRGYLMGTEIFSRDNKKFVNKQIQNAAKYNTSPYMLDLEIFNKSFRETSGFLHSPYAESEDLEIFVHDIITPDYTAEQRNNLISKYCPDNKYFKPIPYFYKVKSSDDLKTIYDMCLHQGYEGVMLRQEDSHYVKKRANLYNRSLIKLKPYKDVDCIIKKLNLKNLFYIDQDKDKELIANVSPYIESFEVYSPEINKHFKVGTGLPKSIKYGIKDGLSAASMYCDKKIRVRIDPSGNYDSVRNPVFMDFIDE